NSSQELILVEGTNTEPSYLGGSICAERAALVQLPRLGDVRVVHVYVVTDATYPLSPGVLCREVLSSKADLSTPITLGNAQSTQILTVPLADLWPFPNVYTTVSGFICQNICQLFALL